MDEQNIDFFDEVINDPNITGNDTIMEIFTGDGSLGGVFFPGFELYGSYGPSGGSVPGEVGGDGEF